MREAREAKGLSLDDVFEKTKLRPAVVRIVLPNQRIDRPWPMRSRPFCLKIQLTQGASKREECVGYL